MKYLKLALCLLMPSTLVAGALLDYAFGGLPSPLLRMNRGIRATFNTAPDCTLYAAANGNDTTNTGQSPTSPKTLIGAAYLTSPGSVVCLLAGRYELTRSFTPPMGGSSLSSWITYKNYGDGDVIMVWSSSASVGTNAMIDIDATTSAGATPFLRFIGLTLDGQGTAADGFYCRGDNVNGIYNSSIEILNNVIRNTASSGIGSQYCDYLLADHNIINHNGYLPAACSNTPAPSYCANLSHTSGISFYKNVCKDSYDGLHLIITNNVVVGDADQSSNDTDGNGIILDTDLPSCGTPTGGPGALVANNIVYGNGGRCIVTNQAISFWIVNNTCYTDNLDLGDSSAGEFGSTDTAVNPGEGARPGSGYYLNNISVSWNGNPPYDQSGDNTSSNTALHYYNNLFNGGSGCCNFSTSTNWNNPAALNSPVNPQFVGSLPYFHPSANFQYSMARPPVAAMLTTHTNIAQQGCSGWVPIPDIDNGFLLPTSSPAYNQGIDPTTSTDPILSAAMSANLKTDIQAYIYSDINCNARTGTGNSWNLGAN